ncbi:MAG: DNA-3-methyladenine glycosylase 2 family protein, partial [Actinobacteria bacterium]|nr:DNA-3-methyladenine glycosylase 2 family protein [Actinomycetota bacterium]
MTTRGCEVDARAWGAGAGELLEALPSILGDQDSPVGCDIDRLIGTAWHGAVRAHAARWATQWRAPASRDIVSGLVSAVLGQRVTGGEAHQAWQQLVRELSAPAPEPDVSGPRLLLPPTAQQWLSVPRWQWQAAGVDA